MKMIFQVFWIACTFLIFACGPQADTAGSERTGDMTSSRMPGQSGVVDDVSQPNIVQVASGSPDFTTLVTAIKAAELVDVLTNAGPFTVFAPTNAAFDKLPAGTVEGLLKAQSKPDLINILEYHVYVGVIRTELMRDGQTLGQVNGGNIRITMSNGKPVVNGTANIVQSITTSNGVIHVIDEVLLPG